MMQRTGIHGKRIPMDCQPDHLFRSTDKPLSASECPFQAVKFLVDKSQTQE